MHTLKDKVTGNLSNLFSNSPSSKSPDQILARPKDGKSLSSIFSYILPAASFDVFRSNKQKSNIKPIESQPVRWNSKRLLQIEKPLDRYVEYDIKCEKKAGQKFHDEDGDYFSARSTASRNIEMLLICEENGEHCSGRSTSSETFDDVADSHSSERSMPNLTDDSLFIYPDLYDFFQSCLPNIVKGCQWVLLYSTVRDGISLRTLLRKSADVSGPCLLITGDKQGAVCGGLLECPLTPTGKRKYQGTNQAFVFTTIYGEPRLFRPTGVNRYFYLCLNDLLALGGGGNFALCLDEDLLTGTSGPCDTFGSLCLAHSQEFELKNVELWGFTYASKYLG